MPIQQRDEITESSKEADVRDVGAPDFVWARDPIVTKEVRIDRMTDERNARAWLGVYGFESEDAPERPHAILADLDTVVALEDEGELQNPVLRMIGVLLVERRED